MKNNWPGFCCFSDVRLRRRPDQNQPTRAGYWRVEQRVGWAGIKEPLLVLLGLRVVNHWERWLVVRRPLLFDNMLIIS